MGKIGAKVPVLGSAKEGGISLENFTIYYAVLLPEGSRIRLWVI